MQENSYNQIRRYFQNLVEQSRFLCGFSGLFQRELMNKISSYSDPLRSPYLALFRYELGFDGQGQNTIAVRQIGFAIMYNNIAADDLEAQYNAVHGAEQLAVKVLSRIKWDAAQQGHFLYNSFMKETVQISAVELSKNDFGVEVFFSLQNKQLLQVDTADWKDIEKVCP